MNKKWEKIKYIGVSILALSMMVGCGAMDKSEVTTSHNEIAADQAVSEEAVEMEDSASGNHTDLPQVNTNINYNRKIIKNGSIHIQTEKFNESVDKMTAYIQSLEGYIESSNIDGTNFYSKYNDTRYAHLTVRIPQKSFDTFMNKGGEFGNVLNLNSSSEDVTNQYVDTETRLKALNIRKERLLALLEKSGELKELFEIEKELGEVTYEIESLKGTLQNYDSLVDMATIDVQIEEVSEIHEQKKVRNFGDEIKVTFSESINSLISVFKEILLCIIALIPFLIILVPIGVGVYFMIKGRKNKKKSDKIGKKENKEK